jgi:hypothetical protein
MQVGVLKRLQRQVWGMSLPARRSPTATVMLTSEIWSMLCGVSHDSHVAHKNNTGDRGPCLGPDLTLSSS